MPDGVISKLETGANQPRARLYGEINWIGLLTLTRREIMRFMKVPAQTVFAPLISTILFMLVFLLAMGGLTLLGYIILLVTGERILGVVIGHGGVTRDNVHLLWLIMVALVGFFIAGAMGVVTSKTFYAMGDTRTPTRMSIVTYTLYIPAKVLGFFLYGLMGLAVVTSAYLFLNLLIQVLLLEGYVIPGRERQTPGN